MIGNISLARLLMGAGIVLVLLGAAVWVLGRMNLPIGRLPGDIVWRGKNSTVYFPIVTCVLLSLIGSLVLWLLNRRP